MLRRVRSHERTLLLPVVMLTCSEQQEDVIKSYSLGINCYVLEPVDFAALSETVPRVRLYWILTDQSPIQLQHGDR